MKQQRTFFSVADLCYGPQLRKTAFEYVISNWDEVRTTEGWALLRERIPQLEKEVLSFVQHNAEPSFAVQRYEPHAEEFNFYR